MNDTVHIHTLTNTMDRAGNGPETGILTATEMMKGAQVRGAGRNIFLGEFASQGAVTVAEGLQGRLLNRSDMAV